jgi:hypothetical protein
MNTTTFEPRPSPPFPYASSVPSEVSVQQPVGEAKRRRVSVLEEQENIIDPNEDQESEQPTAEMREIEQVAGWTLNTKNDDVICTGMGPGGRTILTIGRGQFDKASTIWKWILRNPV